MRLRHFWFGYLLAWTPYFAGYVAVFLLVRNATPTSAILGSLFNVVPAALLGAAVVFVAGRSSWASQHRVRFVVQHATLAVAYSLLWLACLGIGVSVQAGIERGDWTLGIFRGPFHGPALAWQLFQGVLLYLAIAGIGHAVRTAGALRNLEARAAQAEALRTQAELQALRARLDPHFLFNTLHSLMALVRHDTPAAEAALERFADLLRYVLKSGRDGFDDASLSDEWSFVENYLGLERLRLGARLRVVTDIDPQSLDWRVPAFTLQPLIENAIRHSITPRADGGTLWITSRASDEELRLEIRDDGPGARPDALGPARSSGLHLVRQRLEVRYGTSALMTVDTAPGAGFCVVVCIPLSTAPPFSCWQGQ